MNDEDEILSNEHDFLSVVYDKFTKEIYVLEEMTFDEFMARICTKANGRKVTTMHVYADSKPAKEIINATPGWVEVGRHRCVADY